MKAYGMRRADHANRTIDGRPCPCCWPRGYWRRKNYKVRARREANQSIRESRVG